MVFSPYIPLKWGFRALKKTVKCTSFYALFAPFYRQKNLYPRIYSIPSLFGLFRGVFYLFSPRKSPDTLKSTVFQSPRMLFIRRICFTVSTAKQQNFYASPKRLSFRNAFRSAVKFQLPLCFCVQSYPVLNAFGLVSLRPSHSCQYTTPFSGPIPARSAFPVVEYDFRIFKHFQHSLPYLLLFRAVDSFKIPEPPEPFEFGKSFRSSSAALSA